ncbi:MarR family winged helix-turn-helix transcriptional regulator [Micromonospora zhanjiangensis]|uniref:MarR family winged helix-turn-helix transcriptional regulator n=1 Tax=Micromonospora zhanjiangensis TaxID=1522057 RepID=A0ABV8KUK1_9ACTN
MSQPRTEVTRQPIGYWTGEAYRHIAAAIRANLAAAGVTQPQWWMLNHVANGDWTPAALLDRLAPFNANEQHLDLDRELGDLIDRGWLTRAASTQRLRLTPAGEQGLRRARESSGATHRRVIAGVTDEQYDDCIAVLRRIVGNLGGDPSPQ